MLGNINESTVIGRDTGYLILVGMFRFAMERRNNNGWDIYGNKRMLDFVLH